MALDHDLGVQREVVDVAAPLAGNEERLDLAAEAEAGDGAGWKTGRAQGLGEA